MGKNKEYELAIKIAGEIEASFYQSMGLTKKEIKELARESARWSKIAAENASYIPKDFHKTMQSMSKGLEDARPFFDGFEKMAKTSFAAVAGLAAGTGALIGTGLAASVSAGSGFETAFAGVKKTVSATDEELVQMREDIRQMAKEMPTAASELAEIAETAGQLAIPTESIVEFTRTMANMDVATDLSSTEAATGFAQFANITGMAMDKFDELGSVVVSLGNNTATAESNIVDMGMRVAAAGSQIGLSEDQIMAYSAALSSVGIEAEAGGTSFSKLMVNMQLAAETGKDLNKYAKVAGMSGSEFKKAFKEDAAGAINAFLKGLKDSEKSGKSAIAVLDEMEIKETRLRDTLLRAANASDMFEGALENARTAWEENIALTNEATQFYATFENQCGILGNKITDLGIGIYDDLKPGLTDIVGVANDFIDSMAGQQNALGDVLDTAVEKIPTAVRKVKEAGKAVGEFAEPFLEVGGWLSDNPGVLAGTITSVGASLAAYNIASGVASLASALGTLGPAGAAVIGVGAVAGVLIGVGKAVKTSAAEAKKANLASHFGDISLSMRDLQETAAYVVGSRDLEQIRESMRAMSELDGLTDEIANAAAELNRMNWKIEVGMELSEEENGSYQRAVNEYVQSVQDYVDQHQYAINIAINTLLGDNSSTADQVAEYYAGKRQKVSELQTEINEKTDAALEDGVISKKEAKEIAEVQNELSQVKSSLTGGELDAKFDSLRVKYGDGELNADSFINLQAEIQSMEDEMIAGYNTEYQEIMSWNRSRLAEKDMTQDEFDIAADEAKKGLLQQELELYARDAQFQTEMIKQAYSEEWKMTGKLYNEIEDRLGERLPNGYLDMMAGEIYFSMDIDKPTQDAFGELYQGMQPSVNQMQEIIQQGKEYGIEVPDTVSEVILDTTSLGAFSGNIDDIWKLAAAAANGEEHQKVIEAFRESGGYMPEAFMEGMEENQWLMEAAAEQSYLKAKAGYDKYFSKGIDVSIPVKIVSEMTGHIQSSLPGHADGGIFDTPHVAWFAEEGPEAAIPIDGSRNAIELWRTTGELLGMESLLDDDEPIVSNISTNSSILNRSEESSIVISPVFHINVNGGAGDAESIGDAVRDVLYNELQEFVEDALRRSERNKERCSFR